MDIIQNGPFFFISFFPKRSSLAISRSVLDLVPICVAVAGSPDPSSGSWSTGRTARGRPGAVPDLPRPLPRPRPTLSRDFRFRFREMGDLSLDTCFLLPRPDLVQTIVHILATKNSKWRQNRQWTG